jgi:hypothetical protein
MRIFVFGRIADDGVLEVFYLRIEGWWRFKRGLTVRRTKGSHYPSYGRLIVIPLDIVLHGLGGSDVLKELQH